MPVNVIACAIILAWAVWCCLNPRVHDGIVGKFIFAVIALAALSVILGNTTAGIAPSITGTTLHLAIAALGIRHAFIVHFWPRIKRSIQCSSCPSRTQP